MNEIFNYTFNNNDPDDGIVETGGRQCVRLLNFGAWPYMSEPSEDYGEGRCALWHPRLAAGVAVNKNFRKQNIDRYKRYTLFLRIKVINPLDDAVKVGFFASSGEFNVLNEGPLTGVGPFTELGKPNELSSRSIIKAFDIDCSKQTDDFFDVKVSVNGDYILECLYDSLPESYVYVGIMNFKHRDKGDYPVIAISQIRVCEKESYIAFESTSLQVNSDSEDSIEVVMKFRHKGLGAKVQNKDKSFRINSFFCGLFNTMDLQTQIIPGNESSTVIIKGFKQIHINDEFSVSPVLIGTDDTGRQQAIFGDTVLFSLADLYRRYFVEKRQLPKSIMKWFTPDSAAKIKLYNKTPVNSDFYGFGALYYPWIYLKDPYGRNYTEKQAETELDRLKASGVRIVRVTLFASSDWYEPESESWNFWGKRFEGILCSLCGIEERGIDILLNFEWGNSMNERNAVFGDEKLAALPFDKQCEIFATFVRDYLAALVANGINAVKYVTFFSEPGSGFINGYNDEKGQDLLDRYKKCIGAVHDSLKEAGVRGKYKFILGNVALGTEMWNSTWQLFAPMYEALAPYGDQWSYHNYNKYVSQYTNTALKFENMMTFVNDDIKKKTGVAAQNVWIDEYNATDRNNSWFEVRNASPWNPVHMIAGMVAFMNIGYKTVLHWTFTNTLWVGSRGNNADNWKDGFHCWGLVPNPLQEKLPYNSFYAYQMVASHILPGKTYRGDNFSESGLCCTACESKDGDYTVIVVNSNVSDMPFELSFEKEFDGKTFNRYLFEGLKQYRNDKETAILPSKEFKNVSFHIKDMIPCGSVAVYTTIKE
ncbi:MAG: hypothetical protein IKZ59_07925 [Clostridia bacterium]|nr:hypothetical protein [Clostridia bacterium]